MFDTESATVFVGVATADSMPGGSPRRVRPYFGSDTVVALRPPRYAQLVAVTRLSARVSPELSNTIQDKGNRVLLIPWPYGPDCTTGSWDGSTLWIEPGTQGLFGATLRPRDEWVTGVPTLDVWAPDHNPFPRAVGFSFLRRGRTPLTPDEYLSFLDSVSRISTERVDRIVRKRQQQARFREILAWAKRHPSLTDRYPLKELIERARYQIAVAPLDTTPSPLAGTWRLTIEIPNHAAITVFARTVLTPDAGFMDGETPSESTRPRTDPYGYYLLAGFALDSGSLPSNWPRRQGYLGFSFKPVTAGRDSTVWKAGLDFVQAVADMMTDSAAVRRLKSSDIFTDKSRSYTPGVVVMRSNGRTTLTVPLRNEAGELIGVVRGRRISVQHILER